MTDSLQRMIDQCVTLQARIAPKIKGAAVAADIDPQAFYLKENANALAVEAHEALNCVPWKFHKADFGRGMTGPEKDHMLEETIDCMHFVINIFLGLGVSDSAEVEALFFAKHEVNMERQLSGY